MTTLSDNDRIELAKFLRSPSGQNLLSLLRENPPASPWPVASDAPHNIQLNHGWDKACSKMLRTIQEMAEAPAKPAAEQPLTLHDTKKLGKP